MERFKQAVAPQCAELEQRIFREEAKVIGDMKDLALNKGAMTKEDFVEKAGTIYANNMVVLLNSMYRNYHREISIFGGDFRAVEHAFVDEIRLTGKRYSQRFAQHFMACNTGTLHDVELFRKMLELGQRKCDQAVKRICDDIHKQVVRKRRAKIKNTTTPLITIGVLGVVFFGLWRLGLQSAWQIKVDAKPSAKVIMLDLGSLGDDPAEYKAMAVKYAKMAQEASKSSDKEMYSNIKVAQGEIHQKMAALPGEKGRKENLKKAAEAYEEAIKNYSERTEPVQFANLNISMARSHLAIPNITYTGPGMIDLLENKPMDERALAAAPGNFFTIDDVAEHLEKALVAFNDALKTYTAVQWPKEHAMIQADIGATYAKLSQFRSKVPNLRNAIIAYKRSLALLDRQAHCLDCGVIYNNLAVAYYYLSDFGVREEEMAKVVLAFDKALMTFKGIESQRYAYECARNRQNMEQQIKAVAIFRDMQMEKDEKVNLLKIVQKEYVQATISLQEAYGEAADESPVDEEYPIALLSISELKI